jgi:hypothetical protein
MRVKEKGALKALLCLPFSDFQAALSNYFNGSDDLKGQGKEACHSKGHQQQCSFLGCSSQGCLIAARFSSLRSDWAECPFA